MAGIKLQKFLGIAPRVSPELLPATAAQEAADVKLYSGDLIPFRKPKIVANSGQANVQTLYVLRDPSENPVFLSWTTDVDVVVASSTVDDEQRFYYTGDGVPKVSTYDLATAGAPPYPALFYELGLPLPETELSASPGGFTTGTSSTIARDAANVATIVTAAAHNLRTGHVISVRDFADPDDTFNATNVTATVIDDTTFTYSSPGDFLATKANTDGKIDLAGDTESRSYVYTWFTPWDEESIASDPSEDIFLKEGETVTVTNIPNAPPAGDNYIRGVRLYRTVSSTGGADFFRLKTLWFPTLLAEVERTTNVSTVKLAFPHNLIKDDRFKIAGCADATFDITDGIVKEVIDLHTFTYDQVAADVGNKAETSGVLFHDVAESVDDPARYWGDVDYDFTDDFLVDDLFDLLSTDDYDPPHPDMVGIRVAQNNILVGFFGNQFCVSEPSLPHAWPLDFRRTIPHDIVAVEPLGGFMLILTDRFPYQVSGNNPATLSIARIDTPYPCLSKKSVVNMGYGVVFATHGGLALYSPSIGVQLLTKFVHYWETWEEVIDPATITADFFNGKYFASHSNGAFQFERDEKVGGFLVNITNQFQASYTDEGTNQFYFVADNTSNIYEFDPPDAELLPAMWKSKVFITKDCINLGAAKVVADYSDNIGQVAAVQATNAGITAANTVVFPVVEQFATINGGTDFVHPTDGPQVNFGTLNSYPINGDGTLQTLLPIPSSLSLTFKLYADKELVFTRSLSSSDTFRLPTGYRTDTYEVEVVGRARVRSIHLSKTPYGLRDV